MSRRATLDTLEITAYVLGGLALAFVAFVAFILR